MSFGGSNSGGTTTTQNQIPAWLQDAYQTNIGRAEGVADAPFEGYGSTMTAGDNDYLAAARDQAAASGRVGQDERILASQRFGEAGNMSPLFVDGQQTGDVLDVVTDRAAAGSVPGSNLSAYTNPYESQVVQQSLRDIDLQRDRQANADNASTPSGAFGGSRQGVGDALRNERFDQQQLDTATGLRQQGYDRATGLLTSDLDRGAGISTFNAGQTNQAMTGNADRDIAARNADAERRQAALLANQGNEVATAGINLQGAQGLLSTANDKQAGTFNTQQALQTAGSQLQGNQQSQLDSAYQEFLRQQQDPYQKQTLVNSAVLGVSPGAVGSQSATTNSKAKGYAS